MRLIHLFLVGCFVLLLSVSLDMWQSGALSGVAPVWIAAGALVAIGTGIMLSALPGKPTLTEEMRK